MSKALNIITKLLMAEGSIYLSNIATKGSYGNYWINCQVENKLTGETIHSTMGTSKSSERIIQLWDAKTGTLLNNYAFEGVRVKGKVLYYETKHNGLKQGYIPFAVLVEEIPGNQLDYIETLSMTNPFNDNRVMQCVELNSRLKLKNGEVSK